MLCHLHNQRRIQGGGDELARTLLNSANIRPNADCSVSSVIRTLGKIIKIVATRCPILRLKCTKFNFSWGSAPDPAGGAYSALPDPLAALRGPTSKGREGDETPPLHAP